MLIADGWTDYELIDTGFGEKLERWGNVRVIRPDPQILWPRAGGDALWQNTALHYRRSASGGGSWGGMNAPAGPERWQVSYKHLRFFVKPTDFKHMGLFPEQAVHWDWAAALIQNAGRPVRALNLFAYTGGATAACLAAGADVTHVDAAKGMNQWAKDNITLSGLAARKHRVLTDDVMKFIRREARRGSRYDCVTMDPPAFGRGPSGEVWKLSDQLYELTRACMALLSDRPLFVLLNAYAAGISPCVAAHVLRAAADERGLAGAVACGEIGLRAAAGGRTLPCGLYGRLML